MEHKNPFRFGRVVTERHFCDRHEELQRTVANLRSENSLLVHSPRRYGKTSLVSEAFAHVEGEIETGFVDLFGATDLRDFAGAWLRGLSPLMQRVAGVGQRALSTLRNLLSSTTLQLRVGPGGAPVFTIGHSPAGRIEDQELAELLDLPEALARKRNKWVVIALDEVQEVANVPGLFSQDLRVAHRLGSSSTVAGAVAALVEREILLRQKDGSYSIANPALGMWARARLAPPDM